jgi:hypothetical protein
MGPTVLAARPEAPSSAIPPSYYPVAVSTAPYVQRKSHLGIWVALAGFVVLTIGATAAAAGFLIYRAHRQNEAAHAAAAAVTATPTATETPAPIVTATAADPTATATATTLGVRAVPHAADTTFGVRAVPPADPATHVSTRAAPSSTSAPLAATGVLRTFAIATGRPVYVDGREVGVGGSKIATVCGRHFVAVGTANGKHVDIPCTGAPITVGTPDGT